VDRRVARPTTDDVISIVAVVAYAAAHYLAASMLAIHFELLGRSLVFYEADRDALALLRAAKEHHDRLELRKPLSEGSRVAPGWLRSTRV
jgi:hypothetical protein